MTPAIRQRNRCAAHGLSPRPARAVYVLASAIFAVGLVTGTKAQTVDCAAPSGPVAQVICGDPELIALDLDIGDAFRELIRATPRTDRPAALRSQRDWLIQRNNCLGADFVAECLRAEIEYRLTDISQRLATSVGTDQPFGRVAPATNPAAVPQGPREIIDSVPLSDATGTAQNRNDPSAPVSGPLPPRVGGALPPVDSPPENASPPAVSETVTQGPEADGRRPSAQPTASDDVGPLPVNPAPLPDADAREIARFLSGSIWRAEIASGIRPGTIYMFHANGLLLTADCVEAYRIGSWRMEGDGLRLKDGSGREMTAKILDRGDGYVRLKLTERRGNKVLDLVFRPVRGPFACIRSR